jgi:catechol 2,3-dioxygenase-like lactoylglutathione lyase family enzyme
MRVPIDGILETALYATDLEAEEDFLSRILGLEVIARVEGRHVFFRCGAGILLVFNPEATQPPSGNAALPVPAHGAHGAGHVCFRVSSENLHAVKQRLELEHIEIEADFHWPNGARSIYFRDPAGNSLECAEPALWGL